MVGLVGKLTLQTQSQSGLVGHLHANTQALDGQMLIFNGTANNYEPTSIPNQSIDQLTDTDLTGLGDDMILR